MEYPPVTIVMTTWFTTEQRIKVAIDTLRSWVKYLKYEGELCLVVSDDGSIIDWEPERVWKGRIDYTRQERRGVGASLNAGMKIAFERSPIFCYLVDDWALLEPFDMTPWVYMLLKYEDIGIVRFGPPHPHLFGKIEPISDLWQGWALRLERHGLCIGHRPEIFHRRMIDAVGLFDEMESAQECERLYSVRWAENKVAPDIVLALLHPFWHIDQSVLPSTSGIDPREG